MKKSTNQTLRSSTRLIEPFCPMGTPPDMPPAFTVPADKVIMVVDKPTALRLLSQCRDRDTLPS